MCLLAPGPWRASAIAALLLIAAGSAANAQPTQVSLVPVADTSIFVGNNYEERADGAGPHVWTSVTAGNFSRRALLRFDLSSIPPGSLVREARMVLFLNRSISGDTVVMHRLLSPWGEGTSNAGSSGAGAAATPGSATWRHRFFPDTFWTTPGGDFQASPSASVDLVGPSVFYTWGSTPQTVADVQAWLDNPGSNHGWILIGSETGERFGQRFESRENATAQNRPRLVVVYEPGPPPVPQDGDIPLPPWALALLAAGMGAALLRRRRR